MGSHVQTTLRPLWKKNDGGQGSPGTLFEGPGYLLVGQLNFLIIWTGGGKFFPAIGISQVPMYPSEGLRNGESTVLLTYYLGSEKSRTS